jgi:hypothetical protein
MKKILHAWEIGDGNGHIRNLIEIARQLPDYQHIFAIPIHQSSAIEYLQSEGFNEIANFEIPSSIHLSSLIGNVEYRAASFVDVLTCYGYSSTERFMPLYTQIVKIIADVNPDLIITESAPTFLIAGAGYATIAVGTSYGIPQEVSFTNSRFPQLDDFSLTPILSDREVETVIAQALGYKPGVVALKDWFNCNAMIPLCYPECDLYEEYRNELSNGVGPVRQMDHYPIKRMHQFAYLSSQHPQIEDIVSAIEQTQIPTRIYIEGATNEEAFNETVTFLKSFDLDEEMKNCARVIHHGSAGMIQAAMSAGRAQFAFPYHAENTQNVAKIFSLSNIRAVGYAEPERYFEQLSEGYGVELIAAFDLAEKLSRRASPGVRAVTDKAIRYLES